MEAIAWRPDGYPANFELPTRPSYLEYSVSCKIGAPTPYYAAGDYILAWDGAGSVAVTGDAAVTNSSTPGRARLRVTLAAGVVVRITATNASDPVRNIRLVPTGPRPLSYYDANPFQPAFLALVRGEAPRLRPGLERRCGAAAAGQGCRQLCRRPTRVGRSGRLVARSPRAVRSCWPGNPPPCLLSTPRVQRPPLRRLAKGDRRRAGAQLDGQGDAGDVEPKHARRRRGGAHGAALQRSGGRALLQPAACRRRRRRWAP